MPPIIPALKLQLLGEIQAQLGNLVLPPPQRIARRLLAYLCLEEGRQPRADLAQLLCPSHSPTDARARLRQAMFQIAQWYGRHPSPFANSRDWVEWRASHPVHSDIALIRLTDLASFEALAAALNLFRGPLLAREETQGEPAFQKWLFTHRQRLETRRSQLFEAILHTPEARDDFALAQTWVERWMDSEPLAEAPVAAAMQLFAEAGRIPEARYHYRIFAERHISETGKKPSPALQERFAHLNRVSLPIETHTQPALLPDLSRSRWITLLVIKGLADDHALSVEERIAHLERCYVLATALAQADGAELRLSDQADIELLYGWRTPIEDGPLRALRAALAIRQALPEQGFLIGLGIQYGEVLHHAFPLPIGPVAEVAHGLAQSNQQGAGVCLGESAYRALPHVPPAQTPRNSAQMASSHWISAEPVPPNVVGQDDFWGRRREIAAIRNAATAVLHTGNGQIIWILGDAGMGKSRLIAEATATMPDSLPVLRFSCQAIYQQTPLHPLMQLFQEQLQLPEHSAEAGRARVLQLLREAGETDPLLQQLWLFWLGLDQGQDRTEQLQSYRHILQESILDVIGNVLFAGPHVTVIEDLQWADSSSLEILHHFLSSLSHRPILVLISSRNPASVLQSESPSSMFIQLQPWDEAIAMGYIQHRAPGGCTPETARILARCSGGIPLYLDSLLRSFDEDPIALEQQNLRTIIRHYIARSGENSALLQRAAVIADTFDEKDLLSICADVGPFTTRLERLVQQGFLIQQGERFAFRHEVLREATYASIDASAIRNIHQRWADALAKREYTDPATLAHHYLAAGQRTAAVHYLSHASRRALLLGAYQETVQHCEKALPLLLTGTSEELAIRTDHYFALRMLWGYSAGAVIDAIYQLDQVCLAQDAKGWELLGVRFGQWIAASSTGNILQGLRAARHLAAGIYSNVPQAAVDAVADYSIGWSQFWLGDLQCGRKHLQRVVHVWSEEWAEQVMFATGERPLEAAVGYLGLINLLEGKKAAGISCFEGALAQLSPERHTNMWLFLQVMYATMGLWLDDSQHTLKRTPAILAVSQQHGLMLWTVFTQALVAWSKGREGVIHSGTAIRDLRRHIREVEHVWRFGAGILYLLLADLAVRKRHPQARAILLHSKRHLNQHGARVFLPTLESIFANLVNPGRFSRTSYLRKWQTKNRFRS